MQMISLLFLVSCSSLCIRFTVCHTDKEENTLDEMFRNDANDTTIQDNIRRIQQQQ